MKIRQFSIFIFASLAAIALLLLLTPGRMRLTAAPSQPAATVPASLHRLQTDAWVQSSSVNAGALPWYCGTKMRVTQDRDNPNGTHRGNDRWAWDFGNSTLGWPIYAARNGTVAIVETGYPTGSGCNNSSCANKANRVVVDHGDSTAGLYLHLAQEVPPRLAVGDPVIAGVTIIGLADTTGWASGPHLHYAVQTWNSSWNGRSGYWWQPSVESLFLNDLNIALHGGNPRWPNWYESGNCPSVAAPTLSLALGTTLRNRVVTIHLSRASGFGSLLPPIFTNSARTDTNGNVTFTLSRVAPGTYTLFIKPHGYVRKRVDSVAITSGDNSFSFQTLFRYCGEVGCGGDINGDNRVNAIDLGFIIEDYFTYSERSDLNGDGWVNALDLGKLIEGYFASGAIVPSSFGSESLSGGTALQGELALTLTQSAHGAQSDSTVDSNTFEVGNIFTLTLNFNTGDYSMESIDILIDYDHCVLDLLESRVIDSGVFSTTNSISRAGTFEYEADKWAGIDNPTLPVSGTGHLAYIPFRVIAGVPGSTTISIRFRAGDTVDSNMNLDGTHDDFLGSVANFTLFPRGMPQRPARSAQMTNPQSGQTVNQNAVFLEAQATDPCDGIRQVTFYAFYGGQWHKAGTDTNGTDSWAIYWDASQVPDQIIKVKAFASDMAGNGVDTPANDNIMLDRAPPTVTSLAFEPGTAQPGELVTITLHASDVTTQASCLIKLRPENVTRL